MPTEEDIRRDLRRQAAGLPPLQTTAQPRDVERDASSKPQGVDTDRLEEGGNRLEAHATRQQQPGPDSDWFEHRSQQRPAPR